MANEERLWSAAGCDSLFVALVNYGPLSMPELRWINRETLSVWILGTLFKLMDHGVDADGEAVLAGAVLSPVNTIRVYLGDEIVLELDESLSRF